MLKTLGVTFDQRLTFDDQIPDECKKASCKTPGLAIITSYTSLDLLVQS